MCTGPKLHTEKINNRYAVNCIHKMTRPSNFARGSVEIGAVFLCVWRIYLEVHTCSTTGKPTHLFRTKCVSLDSV
jgi:hypothetical protein